MVTITESGCIIEAGKENLSLFCGRKADFCGGVSDGSEEDRGIYRPTKFIAQRRKELDMTQKELAEKLGITDRAVSKWETGVSLR